MLKNHFLKMIQTLREQEEVILHENVIKVNEEEANLVKEYLRNQYDLEGLNYPYQKPLFDEEAALWGAKTAYISAQLILYRKNEEIELEGLFNQYTGSFTASSILSTDLCLRFIPDMIDQLEAIDQDDHLVAVLKEIMIQWPYSGIRCLDKTTEATLHIIDNQCLMQLYANRIIKYKKLHLAKEESIAGWIHNSLGNYQSVYWPELQEDKDE